MDRDIEKTTPTPTKSSPQTRTTVRRKNQDRRTQVRFEPKKENRRQNKGRRFSDIDHWS